MTTLTVPSRFNGPRSSGNGGWTAGALSLQVVPGADRPVTVRLRTPPPLDVPLRVQRTDEGVSAVLEGGDVVAEATEAADAVPDPVPRVGEQEAAAAALRYRGAADHPFPTCFVCGPDRPPGDGLHLAPGPLTDRPDTTACVWTPREEVDVRVVWAALDCPGGWSLDITGRPMVLGTMTAVVHRLPDPGERCVVMGRAVESRGRTASTVTTLWGGEDVLARATAVWVAVDPAAFGGA